MGKINKTLLGAAIALAITIAITMNSINKAFAAPASNVCDWNECVNLYEGDDGNLYFDFGFCGYARSSGDFGCSCFGELLGERQTPACFFC